MKRSRYGVVGCLMVVAASVDVGAAAPPLAVDGKSNYTIVVGDDCSSSELHAAKEFQRFIREISGAELPIATDREKTGWPIVCIGKSRKLRRMSLFLNLRNLGKEGFVIRTTRRGLIVAGGRERGTMYGVYDFLENELGCRWFTPDCSRIPKTETIELGKIDRRFVPRLEYRDTDYPNARDADWCARNKMNGAHHNTGADRGGNIRYGPFVHTFNALIPPGEFMADHPEYYSLVKGRREKQRPQLCLTNPDVLRLGKERLRKWLDQRPDATIFSVSQNDWHNYCTCENCQAVSKREGSEAGPVLAFVNALADDVRDDYPDKAISTLAYRYTRKPPRTLKPRDNVIIRLCSIECCFVHPLASDEFNKTFRDDIVEWSKICDRLYVWDYVINYAHSICPFPNLYVLRPNINFFIDHGVRGIYEEACYFTKGAELAELRTYIIAKTLWDPTYDTDKAIDEFVESYYGTAGPYVRSYLTLIHSASRTTGEHIRIYKSPGEMEYMAGELLAAASGLFEQAERAVAGNAVRLHRVQVARLPVAYARIMLALQPRSDAERLGRGEVTALIDRFEKVARKEGVRLVREGGPLRELDAWLKHVRDRAAKLPEAKRRS